MLGSRLRIHLPNDPIDELSVVRLDDPDGENDPDCESEL
jgi:hypothetical protein